MSSKNKYNYDMWLTSCTITIPVKLYVNISKVFKILKQTNSESFIYIKKTYYYTCMVYFQ